jgi:hypothetical protein
MDSTSAHHVLLADTPAAYTLRFPAEIIQHVLHFGLIAHHSPVRTGSPRQVGRVN